MDKEKLERYKKKLLKEKKKREKFLKEDKVGLGTSISDDISELSSYDNHPGDLGSETFEASKNISFRNNDKFVVSKIDDALKKLENGKYGVCERCNRKINEERLDILPCAKFCIDCEEIIEENQISEEKGRPIEEQVFSPFFGKPYDIDNAEDSTEFDGEDTWQILNEYNVKTSDDYVTEDDDSEYVEDIESISNEAYKKQL